MDPRTIPSCRLHRALTHLEGTGLDDADRERLETERPRLRDLNLPSRHEDDTRDGETNSSGFPIVAKGATGTYGATDQQVLEEHLLRQTPRPTQRFGKNWHIKREEIIRRDDEQCVWCGMAREQHQDEYGMDLHVHHRIPRSEFVETSDQELEDADVRQNLLTVCAGCHSQLEQFPIQPLPPPE